MLQEPSSPQQQQQSSQNRHHKRTQTSDSEQSILTGNDYNRLLIEKENTLSGNSYHSVYASDTNITGFIKTWFTSKPKDKHDFDGKLNVVRKNIGEKIQTGLLGVKEWMRKSCGFDESSYYGTGKKTEKDYKND